MSIVILMLWGLGVAFLALLWAGFLVSLFEMALALFGPDRIRRARVLRRAETRLAQRGPAAAVLVLGMVLGLAGAARAQDPPMGDEHARHEAMMVRHEAMMAEMEAGHARLDALVATMEAAEGSARVDAMADLLTELVAQRKGMCAHMMEMHGKHEGGMPAEHPRP